MSDVKDSLLVFEDRLVAGKGELPNAEAAAEGVGGVERGAWSVRSVMRDPPSSDFGATSACWLLREEQWDGIVIGNWSLVIVNFDFDFDFDFMWPRFYARGKKRAMSQRT